MTVSEIISNVRTYTHLYVYIYNNHVEIGANTTELVEASETITLDD